MTSPEPMSEAERRRQRRPVSMDGHLVRDGGLTHSITLLDLNYGGCGIASSVELRPGEVVTLSVLGRGSLKAKVKWVNDDRAGIAFLPEVAEVEPAPVERRASDRIAVPGEIGLRQPGRQRYRVRVLDLSTSGCKAELVERPNVGEDMLVKFDGLEVLDAEVAWVDGFQAGLKFKQRIHPAVLDLLQRRLAGG